MAEKTVVETYIREDNKLIHLVINSEEIVTIETHPFYVNDRGFVKAGELIVGDELLDVNGIVLLVENFDVELTEEPVKVYNFQVEDYHTYHVSGLGVLVHNASNEYKTKTVRTAEGEEKIPIVDKPGSPSWKQAVKELRSARKKGNNYIASNRQQAEQLINEAMPDLSKAETYATNAPKSNYQIHPIDNEYNMPHICYHDWAKGKHNGSAGHIFWEE
ncbi:polymorphic toxin-type HINT domain-containing protein [Ruminococcus bicirculans (ex Wegman et al. 2014)]|uniref:polymorphic toxin-type HINT domain-containing protein n=1 Tax=Ruminococcus bicirculans (ex Wegman et al. 2014) TaxID=1160721 RepID=UPI000E4D1EE6|nr:polymorphic toxin-type HINT domain-containing protein [uncultured Ruminococcus sp.]RGH86379.1 hypothetical protein DW733_13130 [Ruminococcus sp. AM28-13]